MKRSFFGSHNGAVETICEPSIMLSVDCFDPPWRKIVSFQMRVVEYNYFGKIILNIDLKSYLFVALGLKIILNAEGLFSSVFEKSALIFLRKSIGLYPNN